MTRGAGGDHFALREKLKGFESIKDLRDAGLVYEYTTTANKLIERRLEIIIRI